MKKIFIFFIFITSVFSVVNATEIDSNMYLEDVSGDGGFVEEENKFYPETEYDDINYNTHCPGQGIPGCQVHRLH